MKTISNRALLARINRRLARDHERLYVNRRPSSYYGFHYMAVNMDNNMIVWGASDLESVGKDLGVLRESEKLAE